MREQSFTPGPWAAAPALYEALNAIASAAKTLPGSSHADPAEVLRFIEGEALAALAKAEGRL